MNKDFRHFLNLDEIKNSDIKTILAESHELKKNYKKKKLNDKKILAMIFEKPSTRTRVSFEIGMKQLYGEVITLDQNDTQLGRGESIEDTIKVISKYVDVIMYRGSSQDRLDEIVCASDVPIINGLTDKSHPCQIMADLMTIEEKYKSLDGLNIVWVGDGNNVCNSWIHASKHFDFNLKISCPKDFFPKDEEIEGGNNIQTFDDPLKAVKNADVVVTDTWVSM